jgi:hypothetical protein
LLSTCIAGGFFKDCLTTKREQIFYYLLSQNLRFSTYMAGALPSLKSSTYMAGTLPIINSLSINHYMLS